MTLSADNNGHIKGKFTIPANVPAGRKEVVITGSQGNRGGALFVGDGAVTDTVMQRVTTTILTRYDPLAQTFTMQQAEQVKAIDLYLLNKGSRPMRVQLRETAFGVPSQNVLGEAILAAADIVANQWNRFTFTAPVAIPPNVEFAIVALSDEATPSVGIAELSKYDSAAGQWVTSQPYQVGVLLASSNASTWTPMQDRDLAFRIVGLRYSEGTRTIDLGDVDVANSTEFRVQGLIESPVQGATGFYQLTFPDGSTRNVGNGQIVSLSSAVTGKVKVSAIITATAAHSGVLHPGTFVASGNLAGTADYVTPAIDADATGADIRVLFDALIPSGATVKAYYSGIDPGDTWIELPADGIPQPGDNGFYEFAFAADNVMEARVRIKLVLTGTPAARPRVKNLRITVL